jgi:predicted O-linked N-acetylglucosamine transferase (SPINDLY family)
MLITAQQAFARAASLEASGDMPGARAIYDDILAAIPGHPGALLCIARQEIREGRLVDARARLARSFDGARSQRLPLAELWLTQGALETAEGNDTAAQDAYRNVLAEAPGHFDALLELGDCALRGSRFGDADMHFRAALTGREDRGRAWLGLAQAQAGLERYDDAKTSLARALERLPGNAGALHAAAWVALRAGDLAAAERYARDALARAPGDVEVLHVLGRVLKAAGALDTSRAALEAALAANPKARGVRLTLGGVLIDLYRAEAAQRVLEVAIANGEANAEVYDNLGVAYLTSGDNGRALAAFEQALAIDPMLAPALANAVQTRKYMCDWRGLAEIESRLCALATETDRANISPFVALSLPLAEADQTRVAKRWSKVILPRVSKNGAPATVRARGTRLRVGFASSFFREHAGGRLTAGVLERLDRSRIEAFAYSYGPDDGSEIRKRIASSFAHWCDVEPLSDEAAARRIRDDAIDVLVDLNGHTSGNRLAIFAHRPARLQIHWSGYPGSLGFDGIDAIVADEIVVPRDRDASYHERVLRMPRCFLPTSGVPALDPPPARAAHGLPDDALVLACFNQTYKITPSFFDAWLDALERAPKAVLWLLVRDAQAIRNLRERASERGIAPERLVLAPPASQQAHVSRLQLADLALDVLPYGSHTTGVDALGAGVPMLTCVGETFAGRVGASLLRAVELDALIAPAFDEYRVRLLSLCERGDELAAHREHLRTRRAALPLFDSEGYGRDFAYELLSISSIL